MKRILCLFLVFCVMVSMVACGQGNSSGNVSSADNLRGENPTLDTTNQTDAKENTQMTAGGYPPLQENLQIMYMYAEEMIRAFTLQAFQYDASQAVEVEGVSYYPIVDQRFPTYEKLQEYLEQIFTKEYVSQTLLTQNGCVQRGENGVALVMASNGALTDNNTYAGHVFKVTKKEETKIVFTATVYFAKEMYLQNYFFTTPANASEFTTKKYTFELDYTENGWRYSEFAYLRA